MSGSTVEWSTDTQTGNGNPGVAQAVKAAAGGIGYVDLADAKAAQLQFALIKNKAGNFVKADVAGAAAALEAVTPNADLSYNPLNADGAKAYPITAPTWILVYKTQTDKAKGAAIKSFLSFLLHDGEDLAKSVDYAPLPTALRDKAVAQLDAIVLP
jgi:phosphate transport system substrate-binding protein